MNFDLSDDQRAYQQAAHDFAAAEMAPHAAEWDATAHFPIDVIKKAGEMGFCAMYCPPDDGGMGLSRLDAAIILEELAAACPSTAAYISIHNMVAWMTSTWGSAQLKSEWAAALTSGQKLSSYCLTEPGAGSDAAALKTRAARSNEGYVLNGTKAFISGGGYSDAYVVMCRTGDEGARGISTLVVENGTPGLSYGGLEDKMGWRAQPTRQVQFDDCLVPAEALVGEEGKGFRYAMNGLDGGRLNISACSLGGAQAALDKTLAYMGERKAFGQPIAQFQALQFRLADLEIELQAARTFLRQAAWKLDQGAPDATKFCAMAKKFVTEAGSRVADQCLQLHGGYGYLADYGIEKIVRDLRVHQILEGTNEIMRLITARAMLAERG